MPSTPSAARLAAHAASKNPNALKGATPKQTIPVLVLRLTKAEDTDDTIIYKDDDTKQPIPDEQDEPTDNGKEGNPENKRTELKSSENQKTVKRKEHLRLLGM